MKPNFNVSNETNVTTMMGHLRRLEARSLDDWAFFQHGIIPKHLAFDYDAGGELVRHASSEDLFSKDRRKLLPGERAAPLRRNPFYSFVDNLDPYELSSPYWGGLQDSERANILRKLLMLGQDRADVVLFALNENGTNLTSTNTRYHFGAAEIFNKQNHWYDTVAGPVHYSKTADNTTYCFEHDNSGLIDVTTYDNTTVMQRLGWNDLIVATNYTPIPIGVTCTEIDECLESYHACGDPTIFENPCADKINDFECFCGNFSARGYPSNPCDDERQPHKSFHNNSCAWPRQYPLNEKNYSCVCDEGYFLDKNFGSLHTAGGFLAVSNTGLEYCADVDDCYAVTKSNSVDGKGRMIHAKFMRIRLLPVSPPPPPLPSPPHLPPCSSPSPPPPHLPPLLLSSHLPPISLPPLPPLPPPPSHPLSDSCMTHAAAA